MPILSVPGHTTTFGQLTAQQLLHSSTKDYSAVKKEVGLFIICQFLKQSQDGATGLLKTGGQVHILIFQFQNNDCCIYVQSSILMVIMSIFSHLNWLRELDPGKQQTMFAQRQQENDP